MPMMKLPSPITFRAIRFALLLSALLFVWGTAASRPVLPPAPDIAAKAHFLMDFQSGAILTRNNADAPMEPASLTKMMTVYLIFSDLRDNNLAMDEAVIVSERAWKMPGSRSFVKVDSRVPVIDLLKGVIIQSGNDASVALAEHVAGNSSAFVQRMNMEAKRLGLTGTHFVNETGLPDPEHYTTVRDMAFLGAALIRDFPELYKMHALRAFEHNGIRQSNRNQLLRRDKRVDGIKTGHTNSAGFCLVASAMDGKMRLVSVVMGSKTKSNRIRASQTLLNYGFRFFETHRLYRAGEALKTVRIWKGASNELPLGLTNDLFVTIPRGRYDDLKANMELGTRIIAPIDKGDIQGSVQVSLPDEVLAEHPLTALVSVPKGSLWQRALDHILLYFE